MGFIYYVYYGVSLKKYLLLTPNYDNIIDHKGVYILGILLGFIKKYFNKFYN